MLFCGDVVGRSGREAVTSRLPALRRRHGIDFVVVNGENAAAGFGITEAICREFFAAGVDVVTTGNHLFDKREIVSTLAAEPRLLRPANYPPGTPGQGATAFTLADGRRVVVANLMTRLFMDPLDCPFAAIDALLPAHPMGAGAAAAILVDVHGEATSEKMAMGHHLDGRVSAVFGSHSHVPTADAQILSRGTAYQTDAGMCGDYDSVIGMRKEGAVARFVKKVPGERLSPADGEGTMCGVFVATDDATGLALSVAPVRLGGRLMQSHPPD
ncbi:metallophosphoesterase [Allostella humosa]|nr:metallophosphoesterase [Stella humosa]